MASSSYERHPVGDRVLHVSGIPFKVPASRLSEMFDIVLGENAVAFLNYPFDEEVESEHRGYAFVMLNRHADVRLCLGRYMKNDWYLEGKANVDGFDSKGRAYVSMRSARINHPEEKEDGKHLVFWSPNDSSSRVRLGDFKSWIEEVVSSMGVTIVKSHSEVSGAGTKSVHIYTQDEESAAAVKMFCHQFREDDRTMLVRYARRKSTKSPSGAKTPAEEVAEVKPTVTPIVPKVPEKSLVLEPITENYGKFGISYAEAVKPVAASSKSSTASSKSAAPSKSSSTAKPVASTSNASSASGSSNKSAHGGKVHATVPVSSVATKSVANGSKKPVAKTQQASATAAKSSRVTGTA